VDLKDFIDGLYEVVPVSKDMQDRIMQDDIASILDLSKLKLVQSAFEEASYPAWSEMASVVIEESMNGTADRRNVEEWIKEAEIEEEGIDTPLDLSVEEPDGTVSYPCEIFNI